MDTSALPVTHPNAYLATEVSVIHLPLISNLVWIHGVEYPSVFPAVILLPAANVTIFTCCILASVSVKLLIV
jgi:hypothetical protein